MVVEGTLESDDEAESAKRQLIGTGETATEADSDARWLYEYYGIDDEDDEISRILQEEEEEEGRQGIVVKMIVEK